MKKIRTLSLHLKAVILFLLMTCGLSLQAVNLESMSEKKRDKMLLSIAKELVLRYGPDYYRENPQPIIDRGNKGNFVVKFPPKPEERFEWTYAASIAFDNKTGLPSSVLFGNGLGKIITDNYKSYIAQKYYGKKSKKGVDYKKLVDEEAVLPIKYTTTKPRG